jgi:mRNA interferase MazF
VVPLTSNVEKVYPFQVLLPPAGTGLSVDSKARAEQVRTVAVGRLSRLIDKVVPDRMVQVDDALRLPLDL